MRAKVFVLLVLVTLALALPASAAAAPERSSGGQWHLVCWGETLASISRFYGVPMNAIAAANGLVSVNRIWAGTYLWIPTESYPPSPAPGPTCRTKITVRWGDTLGDIGWRYGVTATQVAQANGIWNVDAIYPGQRLCIPWGGVPR